MKCPVCGMEIPIFFNDVVVIHQSCYEGLMMFVDDIKAGRTLDVLAAEAEAELAAMEEESSSDRKPDKETG
jgi:hypothetical protein